MKLTAEGEKQEKPIPQDNVCNWNIFQRTRSNKFAPPKEDK